jgi:hypothetical protein
MLRSKVKLKFQTKLYIEIVKRHHYTNIFEPGSTEILLLEQTGFYREEKNIIRLPLHYVLLLL